MTKLFEFLIKILVYAMFTPILLVISIISALLLWDVTYFNIANDFHDYIWEK